MGANAAGKTTLGYALRDIFNFITKKNHVMLADSINDRSREASFSIDLVCKSNVLYRIDCVISPKADGDYDKCHPAE